MLAEQLANHYKTVWVPEYAREYIDKLNRPYNRGDILTIAKKQLENENKIAKTNIENILVGLLCLIIIYLID